MDPALAALVQQYSNYLSVEPNGKIVCRLNGHCMPPRADVVSAFLSGAKFQKLKHKHQADEALKRYEPFLVVSNNFPSMLYCALTGQLLDRSVEAVQRHMQGQKFKRAKERFDSDQQELKPEPTLESLGVHLPPSECSTAAGRPGTSNAAAAVPGAAATVAEAGPAAADEDGDVPEFWVPEGQEEEEGGEDMEEGTSSDGQDGADSMDEDLPTAQQPKHQQRQHEQKANRAAPSNGAASKGGTNSKPRASKAGKAGRVAATEAARKSAATGNRKRTGKRNVSKPSPAKRAKRGTA